MNRFFSMKYLVNLSATLLLFSVALAAIGQQRYQSLLWKVSGNGLDKPSYLYGTMHISGKLAFQLGDPFYDCIQSADVVALELEPEEWLKALFNDPQIANWLGTGSLDEDYYEQFDSDSPLPYLKGFWRPGNGLSPHERVQEILSYEPDVLNYLMFRYGEGGLSSDFEEDTWLDMHIYQVAKKMGRQTVGLETYEQSDDFIRKASAAEAGQTDTREWDEGDIEDYEALNRQLEPAYRRQDLDLVDSLTRHAASVAFRNFILLERNKVFVANMDSIMRMGSSVFAAMGCAHLPGDGGVIESLRSMGYEVTPLNKGSRNAKRRKEIERRIYERPSELFTTSDGLISLSVPASTFHARVNKESTTWLCLDIANGATYTLSRLKSYDGIAGYTSSDVLVMIDSMLYETVAGEIVYKKLIKVGGYSGIDAMNRTRRGDYERQQVIVIPGEIIILKISATGDKVRQGLGNDFFDSLILNDVTSESLPWQSKDGTVKTMLPARAICYDEISNLNTSADFEVIATDLSNGAYYTIQRHVIEQPEFLDEDSYELQRFARAFCEDRNLDLIEFDFINHQRKNAITARMSPWKDDSNTIRENVYAVFTIHGSSYIAFSTNERDSALRAHWFENMKLGGSSATEYSDYLNEELCFAVRLPFVPIEALPSAEAMMFNADLEEHPNSPFGTNASLVLNAPHHADAIRVDFQRYHEYSDGEDKSAFQREKRELVLGIDMRMISERCEWNERGADFEFVVGDTGTTKLLHHRMVLYNKSFYHLSTCYDSITGMPDWVRTAFRSFHSTDTVFPFPHFQLRDDSYFDALISADSLQRQRALMITGEMDFSEPSAPRIRTLLKELPYFKGEDANLIKSKLLTGLSADTSLGNIDFLVNEFILYPDSAQYQYEILLTLLRIKTPKAWRSYSRLVIEEPPIVFDEMGGSGCEALFDSVRMAAPLLPQLMQLLAIDEYEESMYHLMAMAADSGWLPIASYRYLMPQILMEARNELKRLNSSTEQGYGFSTDILMDYCSLLNPARKEKDVSSFFSKAYTTKKGQLMLDLARFDLSHGVAISDSVIARIARMNNQVHSLYALLYEYGQSARMPSAFTKRELLARLYLQNQYEAFETRPDSVLLIQRKDAFMKGKPVDIHFYQVYKPSTQQWLGHIIAFDAHDASNAWPLFLESERNVVIDEDEDAFTELEREYLYIEELNREFLNFGSGNTDFSVQWY